MVQLFPVLLSSLLSFTLHTVLCACIPSIPKPSLPSLSSEADTKQCRDTCLVTATNDCPFWMEKIKHQGRSPFNPDPSGYKVFRNVKVRIDYPLRQWF